MTRLHVSIALLTLGLLVGGCAVRPSAARPAATPAADWPYAGNDAWGDRFSPVASLSPETAADLTPAFRVPLGAVGTSQEGYPVESGGTLYVTATGDRAYAVDAATGAVRWTYDPAPLHPPSWAPENSKGVGLGADRVYLLTADDRLIALDRATGHVAFSTSVADPAQAYFESMAPLVAGKRVIVGSAGGDEGARGFVAAYDAGTGEQLWRLFTVPPRGQGWMAQDGFHGGGVVWTTPAFDPNSGHIFFGTGNPSPDYFGETRPGPDPYTDSVVAADVAGGRIAWAAQEVAHDLWDYDAASPPLLFRMGKELAVGAAGKNGYWYEWDATDGHSLITPVAFVKEDHRPPTADGTVEWPGPDGGANYGPTSYDPALHLAFVAGINGPEKVYGGAQTHAENTVDLGTGEGGVPGASWTGTVTAIDVTTGKVAWQIDTPTPPIGGSCVTAGGLVLFGQEGGEFEGVDAGSGKVVWTQELGAPIGTAPIVYRGAEGQVYVAVVTGGAESLKGVFPSKAVGALVVFRLGGLGGRSQGALG